MGDNREVRDVCDNFLGREFKTSKGGTFKIETLLPRESYPDGELKSAVFEGTCSICSRDEELFPEKFLVKKSRVLCGKGISFPCACAKGVRWTQEQYKVLIRRKLEGTDWRVLSYWESKDFKGRQTKCRVVCLNHSLVSNKTISQLLDQVKMCKMCSAESVGDTSRKDLKEIGVTLLSCGGNFSLQRTVNKNRFLFTCFDCQQDDYTRLGNCRYVWGIGYKKLKVAILPCRCSGDDNGKLDPYEMEFKINKICKDEGLTFIGWSDVYANYKSKFNWVCNKGHTCKTSVNKFTVQHQRCKVCANLERRISWNFQEDYIGKLDYLYFLNLFNEDESFIKIGRTNNPRRRFREYSCKYNLNVLEVYKGLYEDVWEKEKHIHESYTKYHYYPTIYTAGFMRECYKEDILSENIAVGNLEDVTGIYKDLEVVRSNKTSSSILN